jgi:branched-chain amino acid transport system permease protein
MKVLSIFISTIVLLLVPVMIHDAYALHILIVMGISILLSTALRLTLLVGIMNLGQIAFYAIGAYALELLYVKIGVSFWICLPLAGIAAGIIALGFGYVTVRVKGLYFCMMTMVLVTVVQLAVAAIPFLGGYLVTDIPPPNPIVIPNLYKIEFVSKVQYYYLMVTILGMGIAFLYGLEKSRISAIWKCIAENEELTQSIGFDATKYRVLAIVISSFFAGIGGAFWASYVTIIGPKSFDIWASIMIFVAIVIGGEKSFWGPVIGTAFLTVLGEALRFVALYELRQTFYAVIVIFVIFFMPKGIIDFPKRFQNGISRRILVDKKE